MILLLVVFGTALFVNLHSQCQQKRYAAVVWCLILLLIFVIHYNSAIGQALWCVMLVTIISLPIILTSMRALAVQTDRTVACATNN